MSTANAKNNTGHYVSRAGNKLADAARAFKIDFKDKVVLDIGSSTGGFTDYSLQNGVKKVIAVEKGTNQLNSKLLVTDKVELHEKTDILDFKPSEQVDIVLIDVSFTSLKPILTYLKTLPQLKASLILAMLKPQFEARGGQLVNGVIKNSQIRRQIIKDFESATSKHFKIINKRDNQVAGKVGGNIERFYLLQELPKQVA